MDTTQATEILDGLCTPTHHFFYTDDLKTVFHESGSTLDSTIATLIELGVLEPAADGVLEYQPRRYYDRHPLHDLASFMRRGEYTYESLESAAELWGFINQIPVGRIMVVTSGEGGLVRTRYGDIEYIHVERDAKWFYSADVIHDREPITRLGLASKQRCLNDLVEQGRSLDLIIWDDYYEDECWNDCFGGQEFFVHF